MDKLIKFKDYLKINTGSENTRKQYFYRIKEFFALHQEFNQETVNKFLVDCVDKNLKPTTFNFYVNAFKKYTKFLKLDLELPKYKKVNKTKKAFLTLEELEDDILPYFDYLFEDDAPLRKLILRLMFTSGLRPSEVLNLLADDIDFKNNWITIRNTKDKEDRITCLELKLKSELKELCEKSQNTKIFNITETYIKWTFTKINQNLNYKKHLTPYMLRHGFAHHCLKHDINSKKIKEMMGHWDIRMTEEYLTLEPHEIIEGVSKKFKFRKGSH